MCNCNNQRSIYNEENNQSLNGKVKFMLTVDTTMELFGDITGRRYFFKAKNSILMVDRRDALNMYDIKELQVIHQI